MITKDLGLVTAYGYAVAGGYTGTEAEFIALLGNVASSLDEIENLSADVETLVAGSDATVTYEDGVLTFGIPRGANGTSGSDGVSPTIQIVQTATGHTVTITDKNHPSGQSFNITDGQDGQDGEDYVLTAQDKAEIASLIGSASTPLVNMTAEDTVVEIEPNKYYLFPEMEELEITLATPTDATILNTYRFGFFSGGTATTLTIPSNIKSQQFSIGTNTFYEMEIVDNRMSIKSWAFGGLPSSYQQVEYIYSSQDTPAQLFYLPYYVNSASVIEITAQLGTYSLTHDFAIFSTASNTNICLFGGNANVNQYIAQIVNGSGYDTFGTKDANKHTFVLDITAKTVTVDGNAFSLPNAWKNSPSYSNQLGVFGECPSKSRCTAMYFYGMKISEDGATLHEYVPCYEKSTGTIGIYDIVANAFLTNVGVGSFGKGEDVDE